MVPLKIGARGNSGTNERFFTGLIDEVKVYNRSLSAEEIANHFALGYNMLLSKEIRNGSSYSCAVTPSAGSSDGQMKVSNPLLVSEEQIPSISISSPQNATYNSSSVLLNITSTGASTWYQYNGTNRTYSSPLYLNFSDGGNAILVWANNSINNVSSASVSFTVSSVPPASITINSPQNTTYGNASVLVNITSNGTATWYQYNGTNYTYTAPLYRNFSDGGTVLLVWANNSAGATSGASVSFAVDTGYPAVLFVSPTTQAGNYSQGWIAANASATSANFANLSIYLYRGSTLVNSSVSSSAALFANFTGLADGAYNLTATALNSFGRSSSNYSGAIVLDTAAPVISILSPLNNSNGTYQQLPFKWVATDGMGSMLCNFSVDGSVNRSNLVLSSNVSYVTTATANLSFSSHNWSVSCWDSLNNTASSGTLGVLVVPAVSGNASSINASGISNVSVDIGGSNFTNTSTFNDTRVVEVKSASVPVLQFSFNFPSAQLDLSALKIATGSSGSAAYIAISGANATGGQVGTKTVFVYNVNTAYNAVCIKNVEGASASDISSGCNGANETSVLCNGAATNGMVCTLSGTTLNVSGLLHSAVLQYTASTPSPTPSGSGSSNGGGEVSNPYKPANSTSKATVLVQFNSTACEIKISRAFYSSLGGSSVVTIISNSNESSCALENFTVEDAIPENFSKIENIKFLPAASSINASSASFAFQSLGAGESAQLNYSVAGWVPQSRMREFSAPVIYASVPVQQPAKEEQQILQTQNETKENKISENKTSVPATPVQKQKQQEAVAQQAVQQPAIVLPSAICIGAVVLAGIAAVALVFKRKRRGL